MSGGAGFRAAALQSRSSLAASSGQAAVRTQAVSLINFINVSGTLDGTVQLSSSGPTAAKYDVSGDGVVSPYDLLLVVQGLQKSRPTNQAIQSSEKLVDRAFWDSVLSDLDVADLIEIAPALAKSNWLKRQ